MHFSLYALMLIYGVYFVNSHVRGIVYYHNHVFY